VRVTRRPHQEARPQRVAQRAAGQCEAKRVILVHRVGDKVQAAARIEQAEVQRARDRMARVRAHRHRGGWRVRDSGVDGGPRCSRLHCLSAAAASARAEASVASAAAAAACNAAYVGAAVDSGAITTYKQQEQQS
jgi:hypothetical protein